MPIVHGTTIGPAGATGVPPTVEITLVGLDGTVRPGWSTDADQQVTLTTRVQPAPDGSWSVDLIGNARVYSPWGDTVYRVVEGFNDDLGRAHVYYIGVPATGGPYWVGDIRTGLVPDQPIEEINGVISVEGRTGVVDLSDLYVQRAGSTMAGSLGFEADDPGDVVLQAGVDGDAYPRMVVRASGAVELGSGAGAADTTLYRSAADTLRTDDTLEIVAATAGTAAVCVQALGDTGRRLLVDASGAMTWGSGAAAGDTTLYRSGLDELTTDDSLIVGLRLAVGQPTVGAGVATVATDGTSAALLATAAAEGTEATGVVMIETPTAGKRALDYRLTGDTAARLSVDASGGGSGTLVFGDGTAADVNLYRAGADTLATDDTFTAPVLGVGTGSPAVPLHVQGAAGATAVVGVDVSGDVERRLLVDASGAMTWGSGAAAGDTTLYRSAADTLRTDDSLVIATRGTVGNGTLQSAQFHVEGDGTNQVVVAKAAAEETATVAVVAVEAPTTGKRAIDYRLTGDTEARLAVDASAGGGSATLVFGDGTAADTTLYRSATDTLKTDDSLHVALDLRHLGTNLGFYGAAAVAKPVVTGSRSGNAALSSLLTALASLGLITNSTS